MVRFFSEVLLCGAADSVYCDNDQGVSVPTPGIVMQRLAEGGAR